MNSTSNVRDLQLVQASRLEDQRLKKAVTEGKFNPYPEGKFLKSSLSSLEFADNVGHSNATYSAPSLLRSLDSLLPDYILEAMYRSLHDEDTSLYDFLGIFDHRLIELRIAVEKFIGSAPFTAKYAPLPDLGSDDASPLEHKTSATICKVVALSIASENTEKLTVARLLSI